MLTNSSSQELGHPTRFRGRRKIKWTISGYWKREQKKGGRSGPIIKDSQAPDFEKT